MRRSLLLILWMISFATIARAQDTLPKFSVAVRGTGKILISWHNSYSNTSQISIQRSADSLKNFTTLITVPDPHLPENGALDSRASNPNYYYRLFIVLSEGRYVFTPSRRAHSNTGESAGSILNDRVDDDPTLARAESQRIQYVNPDNNTTGLKVQNLSNTHAAPGITVDKSIYIKKGDSLWGQIAGSRLGAFRDSLLSHTKDTLVFIDGDSLLIKPFVPKEVYRISPYVFISKYGNIQISLPLAGKKHYAVKFFDDNSKLLFELSEIKDPSLILDKSNFLHAGWFHFELYEDGQIKEKNKLFIPKEF
jgi:hypothetical protein